MSAEALLALLALAVAVYTVLPMERRLDLRLRLGVSDWALLGSAVFLVHYIKFYPVLHSLGIAPDLGPWRWGFEPNSASYLIVALTATLVFLHSRRSRLTRGKLPLLRNLSERLLLEGHLSDLLFLLERHLDTLAKFAQQHPDGKAEPPTSSEARQILERVLLSDPLAQEMAHSRPALALRILDINLWARWEFRDLFITALLSNPSSLLYSELRNNQDLTSGQRYALPASNIFLWTLLHDTQRAKELAIYKPFGDFALRENERLRTTPATDSRNLPLAWYEERDRWACPLHAVIQFFDIMVLEALYQGVEWHMWLYYYPSIAKGIIENLDPHHAVELEREWPTPYHFLLYKIIRNLCSWVEELQEIPPSQKNVILRSTDVDHQNDNIPKSAILAIGRCLCDVLLSGKLSQKFKGYLLEIPLRVVKQLREGERADYAEVLAKAVVNAGHWSFAHESLYHDALVQSLQYTDGMLRLDLSEDEWLRGPIEAAGFR